MTKIHSNSKGNIELLSSEVPDIYIVKIKGQEGTEMIYLTTTELLDMKYFFMDFSVEDLWDEAAG